jgi:molybdopterin-guanine dinucleotide biosynthesis protein A
MTKTATAGILLTGGRSRRLGTDKATLTVDGETLTVRAGRRLAAVCAPVVELGDGGSGLPSLRETPAGAGPLAALAAAGAYLRERGHGGPALVLAVDLPDVDVPLLELLRDWPGEPTAVPMRNGRLQLVCARYGGDALLAAQSLVTGGVSSLHALLDVVEHDVIDEAEWHRVAPAAALADVDTPADARRRGIELPGLA